MAINGTLSDIGFVALLQFPNSSRKTGLLQVTSQTGTARFYYDNGRLIHAGLGSLSGPDVLVEVVDWTEGSFTFEPGQVPEETTIKHDLHTTLMWALKERDERKKEKSSALPTPPKTVEIDTALCESLNQLISDGSGIQYCCVVNSEGSTIAYSDCEGEFRQQVDQFMESIAGFIACYPDGGTGKAFIEDSRLSIALSGIDSDRIVVLFTGPGTSMGRLAISLGKVTRGLRGE